MSPPGYRSFIDGRSIYADDSGACPFRKTLEAAIVNIRGTPPIAAEIMRPRQPPGPTPRAQPDFIYADVSTGASLFALYCLDTNDKAWRSPSLADGIAQLPLTANTSLRREN